MAETDAASVVYISLLGKEDGDMQWLKDFTIVFSITCAIIAAFGAIVYMIGNGMFVIAAVLLAALVSATIVTLG